MQNADIHFMKRLGQMMFSTIAAISLALSLAVIALWIRSSWTADTISWSNRSNSEMFNVYWVGGSLNIEHQSGNVFWGLKSGLEFTSNVYPDLPVWSAPAPNLWHGWYYSFLGISVGHHSRRVSIPGSFISNAWLVLPFWLILAITAILPAIAARRCFRMRKSFRKNI
jgi:hypothetical protein